MFFERKSIVKEKKLQYRWKNITKVYSCSFYYYGKSVYIMRGKKDFFFFSFIIVYFFFFFPSYWKIILFFGFSDFSDSFFTEKGKKIQIFFFDDIFVF